MPDLLASEIAITIIFKQFEVLFSCYLPRLLIATFVAVGRVAQKREGLSDKE